MIMWKKAVSLTTFFAVLFFVFAEKWADAPTPQAPMATAGGYDYGNDWYDASKPYSKLLVWEDGVYRISAADLSAAGFSLNGVAPGNLHLYYRGQEQHIYVSENAGAVDFIEFYGLRNDGRVDSIMYRNPTAATHDPDQHPNLHLSNFSDTSAYFLTHDANPGLRYQDFSATNYNVYSPESFFRYEAYLEFHPETSGNNASWNHGGGSQYDPYHTLNSYWITAEGYVGRAFSYGNRLGMNLSTPLAANLGNPSEYRTRVFGKSSWQHVLQVDIDNNVIGIDTTNGIYVRTRTFSYPNSLGATTNLGFLALGTVNNNTDFNNFCWAGLTYDRLFDMDGDSTIKVRGWQNQNNAYFRFLNTSISSEGWVYDLRSKVRVYATGSGDTLKAIVPGSPDPRDMFVVSDNGIKSPLVANPSLNNLGNTAGGSPFVIITHRSLSASALEYQNYRDTNTVNQLGTKIVYVDEIYDEFGYGTVTPLAIKRFCKWAIDNWTVAPEYILLWGKGTYLTRGIAYNLVPTAGFPATDYDFVSDFDPFSVDIVPAVPIGRVNVENNTEGQAYLDKVNDYEHTPWQQWMKEAVFLGGGEDTTEQGPILYFLKDKYRPEIEDAPIGGTGNYYQKYNTGEITNSQMTSFERINEGAALIHFFGHSSSNIYDVDIQEPVLYQNYGKYPLMVAFGCFGGNFATSGKSFGERFVLEPNRGSIGYLANSTAGFLTPLGNYGQVFYPQLLDAHYGDAIGTAIQAAHQAYFNTWRDQIYINHGKQMNLQGDPSIRLYNAQKPDLEITDSDVYFEPADFSAADTVFTLNVITHNLGRVTQDSFYFSVRQRIPQTGNWVTYPSEKHGPIVNQDTLSLRISNTYGSSLAGLSTFDIFVDSTDFLDEYQETNNRLLYDQIIPGKLPAILYPYEYAVVKDKSVSLSASSFTMSNSSNIKYIYEIDTVPEFDSPRYLSSGVVLGTATFSEWELPFDLVDSTVYYWRVRLADIIPALWATASFKYIDTKQGWAQSRPPQFFKDLTSQVEMDRINREWLYEAYSVDLHAFVNEGDHGNYRLANGAFSSIFPSSNYNGVLHTSIRQKDLAPTVQGTNFGDWLYSAMPGGDGGLVSAIANTAPGDYFLAVSERNPRVSSWDASVIDAFGLLGADMDRLRNIPPDHSFIFFGQKGNPNMAVTLTDPNVFDQTSNTSKYDLRLALETNYDRGWVQSTQIGPASDWFDMFWNWNSLDAYVAERMDVAVYAVRADNSDSLIYSGLPRGNYPLTGVDATEFPYMRLQAESRDSVEYTAPQLDHWHVIYNPAPDAVIDPITNWEFNRDTVMQGETVSLRFNARNITEWDMDSLLVRFSVRDAERNPLYSADRRFGELQALQALTMDHSFATDLQGMRGDLVLTIELNPDGDQPEQYHFNNIFSYSFHVLEDRIQPILDVTFDGRHLMDGDIVSPEPEILIEINDDNPFLAVNDTAYEIHFGRKTPNPANLPRIFIDGNQQMDGIPAQLPDNKAQLFFRPGKLEDGTYTLRVQGFDRNGNASGKVAYEINFEVVNEASLTNVLNYPNPFSTSTRFVYTLTGTEVPERFDIQIFTISGRLVKVIDLAGMGDVHIGYNISDFTWDGRDEFGDMLANGVYVYKVIARLNGEEIKFRDEGISQMFNNGYGKMYIMR